MRIPGDRRQRRRDTAVGSRRRYPRLFLDVDWFAEANGCSTLGRGLEISPRGALLPVSCKGELTGDVLLYVSLPERPRMFRAKGRAASRAERGWVIHFHEVAEDDLALLAESLITEYGLAALPQLERRYGRYLELEPRLMRAPP